MDWTQSELAERSQVSRSTIRDFEGSRHDIHRATAAQITLAFEEASVVFLEVPGCGLGVCLRMPPTEQAPPPEA